MKTCVEGELRLGKVDLAEFGFSFVSRVVSVDEEVC